METRELIDMLAADAGRTRMSFSVIWWRALGLAIAQAAVVAVVTSQPMAGSEEMQISLQLLVKLAFLLAFVSMAFCALQSLARPEGTRKKALSGLVWAPMLLVVFLHDSAGLPWKILSSHPISSDILYRASSVGLLAIGPLLTLLLALRLSASTDLRASGAVAGLLAGGIASIPYACRPNDAPLFLAVSHGIALAGLAAIGTFAAPRIAYW